VEEAAREEWEEEVEGITEEKPVRARKAAAKV